MTKDEALKLAFEALEGVLDDAPKVLDASIAGGLYEVVQCRDAITAIKQALAEPEQEPNNTRPCRSCGGTGDQNTGIAESPIANCKPCKGKGQIALAQPELCKYGQEPKSCTSSPMDCQCAIEAALAQPEERNFCQRCGKRTADLTTIHTCTPPVATGSRDFYGLPNKSVSASNADGKCVTAGETAP
jgi:hypothetical protein